jgi:hypothetical protein
MIETAENIIDMFCISIVYDQNIIDVTKLSNYFVLQQNIYYFSVF